MGGRASALIDHAMAWLFSPSAMAFATSAVSVLMMAFSEFRFVRLYFFAPLACAVLASYMFGAFALPCLLGVMDCVPVLAPLPGSGRTDIESPSAKSTDDKHVDEPTTPLSQP